MKKIFAKLKNDQHVSIFSDVEADETLKDLYKVPNVTLAIPFEIDSRTLHDGEWYYVLLTEEQKEEMLGGYVTATGGEMFNPVASENYPEIKVIYMVHGEETLFTRVSTRKGNKPQKYMTFANEKPQVVEQGNSVLLSGEVDAYWTGTRLYFKKFTTARSLFKGMQKIYKELTEKETNEFLSSELFALKEEMSSDFIGLKSRKMIASIINGKAIDLKDPKVYKKYVEYAKEYDVDLEIEDDKIALIDNSDIGKVMGLFGERFYTTDVTKEKREIRTSKKLVHGKRKRAK